MEFAVSGLPSLCPGSWMLSKWTCGVRGTNGTGLGLNPWNDHDQRSRAVHRAFKHYCELTDHDSL